MLPQSTGAGPTIIVADDDDLLTDVLVSALSAHGYRALPAPGGVLSAELTATADLVILDAHVPGVDFDSIFRALRAEDIGVLVVTGEPLPPAGVPSDRYLGKPVDLAVLLGAVDRLLSPTRHD